MGFSLGKSLGAVAGFSGLGGLFGASTGAEVGGGSLMDYVPGIGDARAMERANKQNLQESATNRAFQERMSNTAYQRAMDDMRKAGLNPTLAFQQGGASAPSGSQAQVQSASRTGLADMALKATTGISGAINQTVATQQQQAQIDSTIKLNASQTAKNVADAQRSQAETRGLGKKAAEGNLWDRFYKGINNVLDSSSKDAQRRNRTEHPLIKKLGPASDKEANHMFPWLTKKRGPQ